MTRDWISIGSVLLLTIIWGSSFGLTEVALTGFGPVEVAVGRIWLAALTLALVLRALNLPLPRDRVTWAYATAIGAFSLVIPFSLLAWGQQQVPSNVAAIFISGTPLFILVLARVLLAEPIGARKWIGFGIGLAGLLVLIGPGALRQLGGSDTLGQLACLTAALSYGVSAMVIRKMPETHPVTATAASQLSASVLTLPLAFWVWPPSAPTTAAVSALVALGLVQTGAAQLLRYYTVRRAGPVFVSIVGYLIPIWAGIVSLTVLGEPLGLQAIAAYALVLVGLLVARPSSNASRPPP